MTKIVMDIFEENPDKEFEVSLIIHKAYERFPFHSFGKEITTFKFNNWVNGRIDYFKDKNYIAKVKRGVYRKSNTGLS